ncbi:hypothetical protein LGK97_13935 [Clostridium sp. CS001]|uniref:hypothetical protein n=1 Tax=Clostridium sp. CS001 TaxID=2880648 RepID=UPI001CF54C25|nr:hypothetical protein [Clostridium sp. CS001]MCB2290842.1 hypothetical protein [Clostridium sp. CS001]
MDQTLLEKLQYILTQEFANTSIYNIDRTTYYGVLTKVLTAIADVLPEFRLNENTVYHKLERDHILITSKAPLRILDGNLAVILSIKDHIINTVEVSISY